LALDPIDALEVMCHWLDKGGALLAERARNARALGRPRAAYDVAEQAWQAAQGGPQPRLHRRLLHRPRLIALLRRFNIPWSDQ
jgi:hypothetical protein